MGALPRRHLALVLVLALVAIAGTALAWDARRQVDDLRAELASTQSDLENQIEASDRDVAAALEQLAPELNSVRQVDDRIDELEHTLFGQWAPPRFGGYVYDLESQINDLESTVGTLESCIDSIADYLDGRTFQFFCAYLR